MILFLISFIAGVLTAIAPCVLPLLPVIVGGSVSTGQRNRAYTIAISLGISVVVFTFLLKVSTAFINVPQIFWWWFSGAILIIFGVLMVFPRLWDNLGFVNALNRGSNRLLASGYQQNSFWGDALMGAALGPVFSSCSPTYFVILATVLPASLIMGLADLFAYALGLSGFLLLIALLGQRLVDKLGVAIEPGGWFRKAIGVLFIIVGLAVATGAEASTETWLLNHGFDLTFIEQKLLEAPKPGQCTSTECNGSSTQAVEYRMNKPTDATPSFLTLAEKALRYQKAPELTSMDGFLNTGGQPITISQFQGQKVVLIDFWTYSCINCLREVPYIETWYDKYADQGLAIIGVHTPEFAFEHVLANVQDAVKRLGIKYPVVLDNKYGTWNAFGNQFWPRVYLIDIDGFVVYDHAGEGDYDKTELAIQKALAERSARLNLAGTPVGSTSAPSNVVTVDESQLGSPETYFGANRNQYLGNGKQGQTGAQTLTLPATPNANTLYLGGVWTFSPEYATNNAAGARIEYFYKAKNVYFVAAAPQGVKIKVTRDGGQPLGAARGADIDGNGEATIKEDRLYQLVGDSTYGVHTLEIQIEDAGLQAYTFTFG